MMGSAGRVSFLSAAAREEIVEVRKLVRVEPHEVAIMRDNKGAFTFHGSTRATAPATSLVLRSTSRPSPSLSILDAEHRSVWYKGTCMQQLAADRGLERASRSSHASSTACTRSAWNARRTFQGDTQWIHSQINANGSPPGCFPQD